MSVRVPFVSVWLFVVHSCLTCGIVLLIGSDCQSTCRWTPLGTATVGLLFECSSSLQTKVLNSVLNEIASASFKRYGRYIVLIACYILNSVLKKISNVV